MIIYLLLDWPILRDHTLALIDWTISNARLKRLTVALPSPCSKACAEPRADLRTRSLRLASNLLHQSARSSTRSFMRLLIQSE